MTTALDIDVRRAHDGELDQVVRLRWIWATIDNGIPRFTLGDGVEHSYFIISRTVIADPSSGSGPGADGPLQTLYLGGSGTIHRDGAGDPVVMAARIYKSTDAGASWAASDTGLPLDPMYPVQVVPLAINPDNPSILYAGTTTYGWDLAGRSNTVQSPGGPLVERGYDSAGRFALPLPFAGAWRLEIRIAGDDDVAAVGVKEGERGGGRCRRLGRADR